METQKRVLIVEDEAISRKALTALLRANGYDAESVASAEEALQRINGDHLAIMLVDLDLPGMNGIDFIAIIAKRRPEIQSVLVTATSRERLKDYIQAHPVKYIRKPIDLKALIALIGPSTVSH